MINSLWKYVGIFSGGLFGRHLIRTRNMTVKAIMDIVIIFLFLSACISNIVIAPNISVWIWIVISFCFFSLWVVVQIEYER